MLDKFLFAFLSTSIITVIALIAFAIWSNTEPIETKQINANCILIKQGKFNSVKCYNGVELNNNINMDSGAD